MFVPCCFLLRAIVFSYAKYTFFLAAIYTSLASLSFLLPNRSFCRITFFINMFERDFKLVRFFNFFLSFADPLILTLITNLTSAKATTRTFLSFSRPYIFIAFSFKINVILTG